MTTDEVRRAAENLRNWACDPRGEMYGSDIPVWVDVVTTALLAAPAWHERPTGPGRWLYWIKRYVTSQPVLMATVISQEDIDAGQPASDSPVYGPIPEVPHA